MEFLRPEQAAGGREEHNRSRPANKMIPTGPASHQNPLLHIPNGLTFSGTANRPVPSKQNNLLPVNIARPLTGRRVLDTWFRKVTDIGQNLPKTSHFSRRRKRPVWARPRDRLVDVNSDVHKDSKLAIGAALVAGTAFYLRKPVTESFTFFQKPVTFQSWGMTPNSRMGRGLVGPCGSLAGRGCRWGCRSARRCAGCRPTAVCRCQNA